MEINDYVRTKDGKIGKYIQPELGKPYITNGISFNEGANYGKHSKDIIDLIEVGDLITYSKGNLHICYPCRVWAKSDENAETVLMVEDNKLIDVNINKILTRKQFEANAYKIEKESDK